MVRDEQGNIDSETTPSVRLSEENVDRYRYGGNSNFAHGDTVAEEAASWQAM